MRLPASPHLSPGRGGGFGSGGDRVGGGGAANADRPCAVLSFATDASRMPLSGTLGGGEVLTGRAAQPSARSDDPNGDSPLLALANARTVLPRVQCDPKVGLSRPGQRHACPSRSSFSGGSCAIQNSYQFGSALVLGAHVGAGRPDSYFHARKTRNAPLMMYSSDKIPFGLPLLPKEHQRRCCRV